jgi:hypothetical protein
MTNFWSFLLNALISFIQAAIIAPLFGGPENYHRAMGLGQLIGANALVVLQLGISAFGNFDLTLFFICFGVSMLIWGIKLFVNIYLAIKRMIPFLG